MPAEHLNATRHFVPFVSDDPRGATGMDPRRLDVPLEAPGFVEIGTVGDRLRIEGVSIDDVLMTLDVSGGKT